MSAKITFLDNLSLLDLDEIACCADVLAEAGRMAKERGFEPTFTLVPGRPPSMRIDVEFLPHHVEPAPITADEMADMLERTRLTVETAISAGDQVLAQALEQAIETENDRDPVAPPAATQETAQRPPADAVSTSQPEAQHLRLAPDAADAGSSASADSGTVPDQRPVAAPKPKPGNPQRWTEQQDDQLVELMAQHRAAGMSINKASVEVAKKLGKSAGAVEIRAATNLKARILERIKTLSAIAEGQRQAAAMSSSARGPSQPSRRAKPQLAAISADRAPVQEAVADNAALTARPRSPGTVTVAQLKALDHLQTVPRMAPFTLDVDIEIMSHIINGLPAHLIANELDMQVKAIEGRFDILTNRRTIDRAAVLWALQEMRNTTSVNTAAE